MSERRHNEHVATERKGPGAPEPFGPFVLERRIAVGGSAEVFLARPKIGTVPAPRLVVKKLLRSQRQEGDFDVLEREAQLHRAINHANVVTVFGAGMVGNEPYLAMEYVEGVDLYRMLRRAEADQRRIPAGLAVYIARQIALALSAVHAACDAFGNPLHIVHRDVTPSNVYLSVDGRAKLGDFGIARFEQPVKAAPPTSGLKGKFGYLAPEQVAGEPFDHRADLFALTALFGEMLIGERVFPGSGQLAVLLAIRDVNIDPLHQAKDLLPNGLLQVCERGLARDPDQRFQNAEELWQALEPFERPSGKELKKTLSEWVIWARDSSQLARRIEGQVRDSVERMRAARTASNAAHAVPEARTTASNTARGAAEIPHYERPTSPGFVLNSNESPPRRGSAPTIPVPGSDELVREQPSKVRRTDGHQFDDIPFFKLIEMIATGELGGDDEVSLMGAPFHRIADVGELARHLLPSTASTTAQLFEPGAPDYQVLLRDTPMFEVLAYLRQKAETGALFVARATGGGQSSRKEIYVERGRLLHVASSEREELLGEYLVRRGRLPREQLERALAMLPQFGGRLGDTLIGLGLVDAVDVFRAIRDQGRDRVAALCAWSEGIVTLYRGTAPGRVDFPLDLDLASAMMAGVILATRGEPHQMLPALETAIFAGPRIETTRLPAERGSAPASLQYILSFLDEQPSIEVAIDRLTAYKPGRDGRAVGAKEACAAIVTARELGWIDWG